MNKIGEYTARGIVRETETDDGQPAKIELFDGRFDTAYRVVEFKIWPSDIGSVDNFECCGKLSKNDDGTLTDSDFFRADDGNQIAWAGNDGAGGGKWTNNTSIIDPENLIIEDLFVYARTLSSATSDPINYLVVLEKYEITDWLGALTMAQDRAQGDL
jgi:hypothetical protein